MGISISLSHRQVVQPALDGLDVSDLIDRLTREQSDRRRQEILDLLVQAGSREAAYGLTVFLMSTDRQRSVEVVAALARMPRAVAPFMSQMLMSANMDVRLFAIGILRDLRHPQTVEWLCWLFDNEPDPDVAACALDVALEITHTSMEDSLKALQDRFDDDPYVGFVSALLLDRIDRAREAVGA